MRIIFISLLLLLQILLLDCKPKNSKVAPKVIDGVLDLKNWDFKKDGVIDLTGEWDFYWKSFLSSEDFKSEKKPVRSSTITVPGSWNGKEIDTEILSGEGYA